MLAVTALAPGKVILFGEHAVVYERPAIAVPVTQLHAKVVISPDERVTHNEVFIDAPDIGISAVARDLPSDNPLVVTISITLDELGLNQFPSFKIWIKSSIPVASGLGSGAAVSVALIRGIAAFFGRTLDKVRVSSLAYEVEKIYHGNPSGIDNTVVTFAQPVFFIRGQPPEIIIPQTPFNLVIGDTGVVSPTLQTVAGVRTRWQAETARYEHYFDRMGEISRLARQAIETGDIEIIGPLMDENHSLLQAIGVSSPELDRLIAAARRAGAYGAKLSGGGAGGNMIAMVSPECQSQVIQALREAGAARVFTSEISPG